MTVAEVERGRGQTAIANPHLKSAWPRRAADGVSPQRRRARPASRRRIPMWTAATPDGIIAPPHVEPLDRSDEDALFFQSGRRALAASSARTCARCSSRMRRTSSTV